MNTLKDLLNEYNILGGDDEQETGAEGEESVFDFDIDTSDEDDQRDADMNLHDIPVDDEDQSCATGGLSKEEIEAIVQKKLEELLATGGNVPTEELPPTDELDAPVDDAPIGDKPAVEPEPHGLDDDDDDFHFKF